MQEKPRERGSPADYIAPSFTAGSMADVDYQPVLTGLPVDGFVRTGSDSDWVLKDVETPSQIIAES